MIKWINSKRADFWEKLRQKQALRLFRSTAKQVPAYRDFLTKHRVKPARIKNFADLHSVPITSKKDYLRNYSLREVTLHGDLAKPLIYTSTSGSTGLPFYFHRSADLDQRTSVIHELFYQQGQYKKNEPVLVIVCFGMGVWIGGLITYQSFRLLQERGHNISIITPGINKDEIFKALQSLGPSYKNIILAGYPPFIKDIIDEAPSHGIEWRKFRTRLLFAAEVFTEDFRDYVCRAAHVRNPYLDTMNIYGTADLGAIAFETPLSILIRRLCVKDYKLFEHLFQKIHKTPTLAQYIPNFVSFEADHGDLLLTGDNTIPLIRYAVGDHGGVFSFKEMNKKLSQFGVNLRREAEKAGLKTHWCELPFVYIYERADFSTNLYGLQVYPEPIREALLKKPLSHYLTGKFTMETCFDNRQNQFLRIHLEMRKNNGVPQTIKRVMLNTIVGHLESKNSEYRELRKFLGKRALPKLICWPMGDPVYFKLGIKQRWVKK